MLCLLAGHVGAQTVNANALKAFQASSGGAAAEWKAGPNNSWEASWVKEGQRMVYCYDNAGVLQQKKIVSTITAFPPSVNASIVAAYPQGKVEYAYKVVDRTNQKFFEVQVANAANVDRMRFNLEGKPVGKTTMAAAQPSPASPTASVATPPAATKPAPVAVAPAKPSPSPSPAPAKPAASPAKPAPQPIAMRGESATTTTKPAAVNNDDLLEDDDLGDLLEDDDDLDDLLKDDENWDDIDLGDDLDDDSDLLDGSDDLDDGIELDDEDEDDGM